MPGADRGDREADAQHHVERGEGEDTVDGRRATTGSRPYPPASENAAPAPKATAPTSATHSVGARLNSRDHHADADARPPRAGEEVAHREPLEQRRAPAPRPTPNSAISTPNSASDACSTSRTNTMPSENSAPSPSDTASAAGITAATSGMRERVAEAEVGVLVALGLGRRRRAELR